MEATQIVPAPETEPIKLGRWPRRNYRWNCRGVRRLCKMVTKDMRGNNTAASSQEVLNGALAWLCVLTSAEADAETVHYMTCVCRTAKECKEKHEWDQVTTDGYIASWAEEFSLINVFPWIAEELRRVHGEHICKEGWVMGALWGFSKLDERTTSLWCELAEKRNAERRVIDDAAFAALKSVCNGDSSVVAIK